MMNSKLGKFALYAAIPAVLLGACKEDDTTTPVTPEPATPTVYEELGGEEMVADPNGGMIEAGRLTLRSIVDSAIFVIAADGNLNGYFAPLLDEVGNGELSGFAALSTTLTDFFASATGDDVVYSGLSMADAHKIGTNNRNQFLVNDAAFNNFLGAVVTAAGQNGIPSDNETLGKIAALLETLRGDIVQTDGDIAAQTLYDDLGGSALRDDPNNPGTQIETGYFTLRSVVDSAIFVIAGDDRLNDEYFSVLLAEVGNGDLSGFAALSASLTDFFAFATGSTNPDHIYKGLNMVAAHNPSINNRMGNTADNAAYDAFVEDVVIAAGQNGVPSTSPIVAALGGFLESLRSDIVQR